MYMWGGRTDHILWQANVYETLPSLTRECFACLEAKTFSIFTPRGAKHRFQNGAIIKTVNYFLPIGISCRRQVDNQGFSSND